MDKRQHAANPFWRALYRAEQFIAKNGDNFNPLMLDNESIEWVAGAFGEDDKTADVKITATYLLGLAVGLKYAGLPSPKVDALIAHYRRP